MNILIFEKETFCYHDFALRIDLCHELWNGRCCKSYLECFDFSWRDDAGGIRWSWSVWCVEYSDGACEDRRLKVNCCCPMKVIGDLCCSLWLFGFVSFLKCKEFVPVLKTIHFYWLSVYSKNSNGSSLTFRVVWGIFRLTDIFIRSMRRCWSLFINRECDRI